VRITATLGEGLEVEWSMLEMSADREQLGSTYARPRSAESGSSAGGVAVAAKSVATVGATPDLLAFRGNCRIAKSIVQD